MNILFLHPEIDNFELYQLVLDEAANRGDNFKSDNLMIFQAQEAWKKLNNQFALICRFLYQVVKKFPAENDEQSLFNSNCKSFADFYVRILSDVSEKKFAEREEYLRLKYLLQIASSNTLGEIFDSFLKRVLPRATANQSDFTAEFLNELNELEELLSDYRQVSSNKIDDDYEENLNEKTDIYDFDSPVNQMEYEEEVVSPFRNKTNRRTNLKVLGEINGDLNFLSPAPTKKVSKVKKNKQSSKNNIAQVINWLDKQFTHHFNKTYFGEFRFFENFCYSDIEKMKTRLFQVQRMNLHGCLVNSVKHLNLNKIEDESPKKRSKNRINEESEPGEQMDTFLPLNVAYKLYLECGHMINLHDWLHVN